MIGFNPDVYHRKSIRLKNYDYAQAGFYFVTVCTQLRQCLFGEIMNGEMILNDVREVVRGEWMRTKEIRKNIEIDTFIVMPNHIHGIIIITDSDVGAIQNKRATQRVAPTKWTKVRFNWSHNWTI